MSNRINAFKVANMFVFTSRYNADPSESAESFVIENHDLVTRIKDGLIIDQADVDYALSLQWEEQLASFKGGYRAFRSAFYSELEKWYGIKRSNYGLQKRSK